jgi:hypothetical protein
VVKGVDAIVVTYESASVLPVAVRSVSQSPLTTAIIVVDNGSSDGSVETARAVGVSAVVCNKANLGFAAGVNRGLAQCSSDYVLLLNPDAAIEPTALELLAQALDDSPSAALAGPVLVSANGRVDLGARRFSTVTSRLLWHAPWPRRPAWATPEYISRSEIIGSTVPVEVDYLWGAVLLARRAFLQEIGGLDERFFLYSEDEDLGRQAKSRGLRSLLVPRARTSHVGSDSTPDEALAQARVILSNALLLEKWEGNRAALAYRRGIGPVLAMRAAAMSAAGRHAEADVARRTRRYLRDSCAPGVSRGHRGGAAATLESRHGRA